MSKLTPRVIFSVLISLLIVFAIFATVQAASASNSKAGSHLVSGAMVNLNHDRLTAAELETYKAELDSYYPDSRDGNGHGGCESENQVNPNDY